MAGKGDKDRTSDMKSYWESPLWDNLKKNKYDSYSEFSKDFTPLIEEYMESSQDIQSDEYSQNGISKKQ